jgi:hypothetical protein
MKKTRENMLQIFVSPHLDESEVIAGGRKMRAIASADSGSSDEEPGT